MFNAFSEMPAILQAAATMCVALLFVYLFGTAFPCSTENATHSQDSTLALYWMHRTHTTPYRDWFCEPGPGSSEQSKAAFQSLAREGNVLMPLHGVYLWVLGHVVRLYTYGTASGSHNRELIEFWEPDYFSFLDNRDDEAQRKMAGGTLFTVRWVSALFLAPVLFQLSVEVTWPLMAKVAAAFAVAADQRRTAAREAVGREEAKEGKDTRTEPLTRTLTEFGFAVVFLLVVCPTMALEMTTLYPVCLCTCALLQCVRLFLLDEWMLSSPRSYTHDCFTNKESEKLFQQGGIFAFPLKKPHTLRHLCWAGALLAAVGLTMRPCLCLVLGLVGWLLTLVYLRLHRRVLVRVKAPDGAADAPEAASDGFVDVGQSSYQDKLYAQSCLCYVMLCALSVMAAICFPFIYQKQSLVDFMHLFAPNYHAERSFYGLQPRNISVSNASTAAGRQRRASEDERFLSITGAREISDACAADPLMLPRGFSCSRPLLNIYTITEYFGFPWTALTVQFAGLIAPSAADSWNDGSMWMQYIATTTLVLLNVVPALLVFAYRLRRPYMSYDSPKEFLLEFKKQREVFFNYWALQADYQLARKNYPPPEKPFATAEPDAEARRSADSKNRKHPDDVVKTCISQEEFALKQLTGLLWGLLAVAITANLFVVRGGLPMSVASAVLLPAGMLYAMQTMIGVCTWAAPEAFAPERNRRNYDHLADLKDEEQEQNRCKREKAATKAEEARNRQREATDSAHGQSQNPNKANVRHEELPSIPAEHERTRTYTAGNFSYTTPSFIADGTGWSLSARWCSPAALGEYSDVAWCVLAIATVVIICAQAYPLPRSVPPSPSPGHAEETPPLFIALFLRITAGHYIAACLLIVFCVEVIRCHFWKRADLLTVTIVMFLQAAGGYAALQGTLLTSPTDSPRGGAEALARWLSSFAEVATGPPELFRFMVSFIAPEDAASHPPPMFHTWSHMYRNAIASLCLALIAVHASLRLARLMLESEEIRFVDPVKEMSMLYNNSKEEGGEPKEGSTKARQTQVATHANHGKPRKK